MAKQSRAVVALGIDAQIELERLGRRIREARKSKKISLRSMAERMMVSTPTVVELERGNPGTSIGVLLRALAILGGNWKLASLVEEAPGRAQDRMTAVQMTDLDF